MTVRGRRPPAVLVVAALLCACSSTSAPSRSPAPLPSQNVTAAVAAADALFFGNHYDQAERAYAQLIARAPGDALAQAAYALFLNYRLDFGSALTEARAAVAASPGNGRAQAVLCRVQDWSMHVDDAVAAGARAVSLAPADPLTHLFDSEALADHGDIAAARRQIDAAAAQIGPQSTAYERAELQREKANLAHDTGDLAGELAADIAARDQQPGWVDRSAELAGAYIDNNQLDGAHTVLESALALAPDDAQLLSSLGSVALQQPDFATAEQAYTRLLAITPRDPGALESAAEVAMALHRDTKGATALLLRALAADPTDVAAVDYILRLARIDGDEAQARAEILDTVATAEGADGPHPRPVAVPDPAAQRTAHALVALAAVNAARTAAGLPAVTLDPRLTQSAAAHCFYWLANNALPAVIDLGIHLETPGTPGFTGVRAGDRANAAGWYDGPIVEDITHRGGAVPAVADWMDSVYHRFPIVRPELRSIGYADCSIGPLPMEDMEFGLSGAPAAGTAPPVLVPADGQNGVPTTFLDNELPDPLPKGTPRNAGFPVTATFPEAASVRLTGFSLRDPSGAEVAAYTLSPGSANENSASLLAHGPLRPATAYTAHLTATVDGRAYERTWTFTTA